MPVLGGTIEVVTDCIWGRIELKQIDGSLLEPLEFFASTKPEESNLQVPNLLPSPERFTIWDVRLLFLLDGSPLSLKHSLWWNSLVELFINKKQYVCIPSFLAADPVALCAYTKDELMSMPPDQRFTLIGKPIYLLDVPLTVEQGEFFSGRLQTRGTKIPDGKIEAMLILEGNRERG